MANPLLLSLIPKAIDLVNRFIPDKNAQQKASEEITQLFIDNQHELNLAQISVNKIEAASRHWFVASWRPAIGWSCVTGLVYTMLAQPVLITFGFPAPPIDRDLLLWVLGIVLGAGGGYRTLEKIRGVAK